MSIFDKIDDEKVHFPKRFLGDKYLDDYERRKVFNPRTGKMHKEFVYIGTYYELIAPENLGKAKCIFGITTLLNIVFWALSLCIYSELATSWVIIADVFFAVIVFYQLCAFCRLLTITHKKELKREDNEKTGPRFKTVGIAGIALAAIAIICHLIYGIINGELFGDLWHYGLNIGMAVSSYFTYKFNGLISMKEKD